MSQFGQGARPDHTYSMHWSKQYVCKCNCYNCIKVRSRILQAPGMDKATQTESLPYEYYSEDWRGPEDIENEIEIEEHKVCVMPDVVSPMDLKEKDEYWGDQGFDFKCENKIWSQDGCMPEKKYACQDVIRPCYIKDEVAPETNYILQGRGMKNNFQQPSSICAEKQLCPCGVCGEVRNCNYGCQQKMQIDAAVQADAFECEFPVKCMKCGVVMQGRSCCIKQCLISVYACNACAAHATTSYFQPITQQDATGNLKTVPCNFCQKMFGTTKGMRIHAGRIHKGIMVKN